MRKLGFVAIVACLALVWTDIADAQHSVLEFNGPASRSAVLIDAVPPEAHRAVPPSSFNRLPTKVGASPSIRLSDYQEDPFGETQTPPIVPRQARRDTRTVFSFQEDPFGENQPRPVLPPAERPANQEDPFGENQRPPVPARQEDPFGEKQPNQNQPTRNNEDDAPPVPGEKPPVNPPVDPTPTNQDRPTLRDPVLPEDALPGMNPVPGRLPDAPSGQPAADRPPGRAFPGNLFPDSLQERQQEKQPGDGRITYQQGTTGWRSTRPRSNVYQAPEEQSQPQRPTPTQEFVPAFEPIPGLDPATAGQIYNGALQYQTQPTPGGAFGQPQSVLIAPTPHSNSMPPDNVIGGRSTMVDPACHCQTLPCACDTGPGCGPGVAGQRLGIIGQTCFQPTSEPCPAFYLGFSGGWNEISDWTNNAGASTTLDTGSGSAFQFALGRINGRNLRTEVELGFRDGRLTDLLPPNIGLTPGGPVPYRGTVNTFSGMANAYWEFADFPAGRFRPYVGGGVGFGSFDMNLNSIAGTSILVDGSERDTSFAYQWMAGVNFRATCNLDLFAEYRFYEADSVFVDSTIAAYTGKYDYQANSVNLGLRWKF